MTQPSRTAETKPGEIGAIVHAVGLNPTVRTIVEALGPHLRTYPVSKQDLAEVRKFGMLFGSSGTRWMLTPLGQAVRAALVEGGA